MTKLYTVTMEYEYVIAVEDGEDPDVVAEEVFSDVKYDLDRFSVSLFTAEMRTIPGGWDEKCIPWNLNDSDKRICEILGKDS